MSKDTDNLVVQVYKNFISKLEADKDFDKQLIQKISNKLLTESDSKNVKDVFWEEDEV